jgi:hypothetical protein
LHRYGSLLAVLLATAAGWHVEFQSHPSNSNVQLDRVCWLGDRVSWQAVQQMAVEDGQTEAVFERHDRGIPPGSRCTTVAFIYAWNDDDLTAPERIVESSQYLEDQH